MNDLTDDEIDKLGAEYHFLLYLQGIQFLNSRRERMNEILVSLGGPDLSEKALAQYKERNDIRLEKENIEREHDEALRDDLWQAFSGVYDELSLAVVELETVLYDLIPSTAEDVARRQKETVETINNARRRVEEAHESVDAARKRIKVAIRSFVENTRLEKNLEAKDQS